MSMRRTVFLPEAAISTAFGSRQHLPGTRLPSSDDIPWCCATWAIKTRPKTPAHVLGAHLMVLEDHGVWAGIQADVRNYPDWHMAANGILVDRAEARNCGRIPKSDKDISREYSSSVTK